jgi:hypothetical protein
VTHTNWFDANPRKAKWLVAVICLVLVELSIRALVGLDLLPFRSYRTDMTPHYWANIDPVVGNWRWPNTTFRHREKCIDATYSTNSVGARDPERALSANGAERTVMIGDSMLEGFGVGYGQRTSDMLEQMSGIEHINLGNTGFGTIQEWLAYERFGLAYEHDKVIFFIFPENDFDDNDPEDESKNVYRPFLREVSREPGADFEVYYTVDFEERYIGHITLSRSEMIKNKFDNAIYTANVLRWATRVLKTEYRQGRPAAVWNYDNYSAQDLEIMLYTLERVTHLAGDREVYLIVVPSGSDLEYAAANGIDNRLIDDLGAFVATRENSYLIDLIPFFLADLEKTGRPYRDYTLGCDGHWNETGHRIVAETLYTEIYLETP